MNILLRDERGAVLIWALLFLPLLVLAMGYTVTKVQIISAADVDLSPALEVAVKMAAMQVTPDSQAAGDPRIHAASAHTAFRRALARNLGLDSATLAPLAGSMLAEPPEFVLLIYNGDGMYQSGGATAATRYVFSGGSNSSAPLVGTGFPAVFRVGEMDLTPGGLGGIQVRLDRPGVIAVATTNINLVTGTDDIRPVRWAAAKIVKY